ncbi:hypothetical protein Fmac_031864 [Flemingia macrophylla]|uniref:Uncharacterized protein n=1 Tax=Flemingia macrophylla TaxID=520843 RepID=A0ABD1L3P6_9FABA
MHSLRFIAPVGVTVAVPNNARPCNSIRVKASMVDSSSDFVRRMELAWLISEFSVFLLGYSVLPLMCCNQGQLRVHLATLKGILNVNGVGVLVSSLSVTTCFVKFHPETLIVLFAKERDQGVVQIVKEQACVQGG